jgi:myo-inositol-1(or 4)-monophosphatase
MGSTDLSHFAESAREATLAASAVLWHYFGADTHKLKAVDKQDNSIQTKADLESERTIVSILEPYLKEWSMYAEEGGMIDNHRSRYTVLVDPLDGTSNYSRARDGFGISIALVDLGSDVPTAVFVSTYEPSTKRLWTAARNEGCFLEVIGTRPRKAVRVSDTPPEKGDLCYDASTSPRDVVKSAEHKAEIVRSVIPMYKRFRMLGSNVLAHAFVASGSFEAAVTDTVGGPFDIAGYLLVEEAGGKASNLSGGPVNVLTDKVVITSNGIGHEKLISTLRQFYTHR